VRTLNEGSADARALGCQGRGASGASEPRASGSVLGGHRAAGWREVLCWCHPLGVASCMDGLLAWSWRFWENESTRGWDFAQGRGCLASPGRASRLYAQCWL